MMIPISETCILAKRKMQDIAMPLFKATGLNFFSYARDFQDDRSFSLQTDNELYFAWFESKSPYCSSWIPDGIYTSDTIQNSALQHYAKGLNYGNGIHIFKKHPSFSEVISFGAPVGGINALQFYVNNLELINKFLFFFKEKANRLISDATLDTINVPHHMMSTSTHSAANTELEELKDKIAVKNFYFADKDKIKLTQRELECLALYIKGASTSQIADILQVKKVTADTFMRNVKIKFKCSSRSELFKMLWDLGILKTNGIFV